MWTCQGGLLENRWHYIDFDRKNQCIGAAGDFENKNFLPLSVLGQRDLAMKLLFQTRCPSWLYMVEHGATTIWETWNCIQPDGKVGAYSYNHYAFTCSIS